MTETTNLSSRGSSLSVASAHTPASLASAVVTSLEASHPRRRRTGGSGMGRRPGNGARSTSDGATPPKPSLPDDSPFNEELIEDRYAALQAWSEWTKGQELRPIRGDAIEVSAPLRLRRAVAANRTFHRLEEPRGRVRPRPRPLRPRRSGRAST